MARPCRLCCTAVWSLSLSFSLSPSQTWPYQGWSHISSLSLANIVHPEGTPWILPRLDSGICSSSCPLRQWCHPTISSSVVPFSSCLQSFPASGPSNESDLCISWPKDWSFSFNISPPNEHPGLISFRMDWLDLLAVQRTLKSLLQHHSSRGGLGRDKLGSWN